MAIDLSCYTRMDVEQTNFYIQKLEIKYPNIFPSKYRIYKAEAIFPISDDLSSFERKRRLIKKEIAESFGFKNPTATFFVHVVDKTLEIGTDDFANIVRHVIGENNVLVLFENETEI